PPPVATASSPDLSILSRRHILSLADGALCLFQQVLCLLSAALRPAGGTKKTAPSGRRLRLISGGPASGCEAEPPPGVPQDTGEAVPQCPARHAGVEGRRGPLLQQQGLRIVEAAHPGLPLLRAGDDRQQGIIGAVGVFTQVLRLIRAPLHQKALRIVAQSPDLRSCQGEGPLLQGGVQLFPADAAGRHLEAQGTLPGVHQRLGHGGAVPLVHVEIFQLPQVPGVGVSGLRQQAAGLLRQLVPVRGVVVQQHAAICTEILLPAPRHAGRDQALSGIRRGARRLSSGRTVRRQSQRPTDPGIHQRILRAVEHHRLNAQLPRQGPALRLDQGRQLLRREDAQEIHLPGVVEVLSRLCGLRKSERQGLRPGETVAVGLAGLQGQRLTSLIPAHLIRPVGHKAHKVVPPRGRLRRLRRLRRCFGGLPVSGSGLLLQQVLPQRHGG
ncbi:Archaeal ATPase, partial [Dysosmobacter welbionis]